MPSASTNRAPESPPEHSRNANIKLYPDLALGMLRREKTAPGRIWLLLRHLDTEGRGWVSLSEARSRLTGTESALRVCGWRQLRNLLAQGEGIFWQRTGTRLWLRSIAKVSASLGVRQLAGRPVAISATVLTRRIGTVRAHLYASFHSGRSVKTGNGRQRATPIARKTLKDLCQITRRTQRVYENRAGVRRQRNYALGGTATTATEQETAWRHGRALFRLCDKKGIHGPAGTAYFAWQLPNNYVGPHETRSRGQQKRINKEIADLFMKGITGNDKDLDARCWTGRSKRFHAGGRQAAKAYNRPAGHDLYWYGPRQSSSGRMRIWNCLQADAGDLHSES